MLISLPEVTLLGIDCVTPQKTRNALLYSQRFVRFADAVLVTDEKFVPTIRGIRVVTSKQPTRVEYERDAISLAPSITKTSHVLHMEWDSLIANPFAWDKTWLQYDFIGAPWPEHYEDGWPACGPHNCVGNTGFSLRSRRLYDLCGKAVRELKDDGGLRKHDAWMCRTLRPWLERNGIKFAPPQVAYKFSCENQIYSGQFGFHGRNTMKINGFVMPQHE